MRSRIGANVTGIPPRFHPLPNPSHVETFSVARTPLGIVAAVCNRGISPSLRFFCGKTRPAAARWKHLLAGDPAAPSRCDSATVSLDRFAKRLMKKFPHVSSPTLNRYHLRYALLAQGKTCTQERASPFWWGVCVFRRSRKTQTPHAKGECEGTWFPHAPTGDTH